MSESDGVAPRCAWIGSDRVQQRQQIGTGHPVPARGEQGCVRAAATPPAPGCAGAAGGGRCHTTRYRPASPRSPPSTPPASATAARLGSGASRVMNDSSPPGAESVERALLRELRRAQAHTCGPDRTPATPLTRRPGRSRCTAATIDASAVAAAIRSTRSRRRASRRRSPSNSGWIPSSAAGKAIRSKPSNSGLSPSTPTRAPVRGLLHAADAVHEIHRVPRDGARRPAAAPPDRRLARGERQQVHVSRGPDGNARRPERPATARSTDGVRPSRIARSPRG